MKNLRILEVVFLPGWREASLTDFLTVIFVVYSLSFSFLPIKVSILMLELVSFPHNKTKNLALIVFEEIRAQKSNFEVSDDKLIFMKTLNIFIFDRLIAFLGTKKLKSRSISVLNSLSEKIELFLPLD